MATLTDRTMDLRHLRYFAAVAETCSFTRAAEQLRLSQPALSRQIHDLEVEVGRPLFERTHQGVRLTDAGRRLLRGAKRLLAASEALLTEVRGEVEAARPQLRIAHFGPLCAQHLTPFLRRLVRRYPKLRLHLEEDSPGTGLRRVRTGTLDAVLTGIPEGVSMRGLESLEVWAPPQQVLVSSDHPLAKRRRVRLEDLRHELWGIMDEKVCPGFGRPIVRACRAAGFRARVAGTPDSLSTIFVHVADSGFVSYAPRFARRLAPPGVVFLPTDPERALVIAVHLVWRADAPQREALRWLAEAMAASPARYG